MSLTPKPTPPTGGDYDWTGLTADLKLTSYSGSVFDYPTTPSYGGGGAGASNRPMETTNSYIGTGGPSGNVDARAQFSLSGTSTYYWQWDPPNNAAGQPDLTNFPAPPLFVLGKGYSVMRSDLPSSPNAYGLTVSGSVNSGIGSYPPLTVDTTSGTAPDTFPILKSRTDYAILTPVMDSPLIDKLLLSPSVTYDATGVFGQYEVQAGGESQNWVSVGDNLYPITLSVYDPFVRPDWGDGRTNQTSYDEFEPGRLRIPVEVYIPGANQDDTNWLVSKSVIDVSITPEPPNALLHFWEPFNDTVIPIIHDAALGTVDGDFVYDGLPYNNSDFGDHTATLQVNSQNSELAHFQTFFTAVNQFGQTISNYPNTDGVTANWYHYYNQVINPDSDPPETYDPTISSPYAAFCQTTWELDPNSPWGYDIESESNQVLIGPGAINLNTLPVFALRPEDDGKQWTTHIGDLHIAGIHSYLRTYLEEATHADQIKNLIVLPGKNPSGQRPPIPDDDLDGVPDADERKYGLKRGNPDSTKTYQTYLDKGYPGDSEVLAAIVVLGKLLPYKNIWKQDWANTGLQHGSRPPYPCDASRNIFPWYYHSLETGADTADIPDSAHALTELPNLTD